MTKLGGGLIVDSILPESGGISTVTFTRNHAFSGISTASLFTAGSGTRTNGTYYNVKLYNENTYDTWNGATAIVSSRQQAQSNLSKFRHQDLVIQVEVTFSLIMLR